MNDPILIKVLLVAGWALSVIFAAGVAFAFSRVGANRDRKSDDVLRKEALAIEAVKERDKRISHLEDAVKDLKAQAAAHEKAAIPLTAALQAMLVNKMVNDHTPEADALLKKLTDNTLTVDDAVEFAKLMKERETDSDPRIGRAQQIAAEMLPLAIELRELEEGVPCETRTIAVTVPATETVRASDGGTQEKEKPRQWNPDHGPLRPL